MSTATARKLHKATIERITPEDDKGPYFWLSTDGDAYLEVSELPATPEEEDAWYGEVEEELARRTGTLRMKVARSFLGYGGATFDDPTP